MSVAKIFRSRKNSRLTLKPNMPAAISDIAVRTQQLLYFAFCVGGGREKKLTCTLPTTPPTRLLPPLHVHLRNFLTALKIQRHPPHSLLSFLFQSHENDFGVELCPSFFFLSHLPLLFFFSYNTKRPTARSWPGSRSIKRSLSTHTHTRTK